MSLSLLCDDMIDEGFPCFKVITYLLHLILGTSFREEWITKLFTQRVKTERRFNHAAIHINDDLFPFDTHLSIFYIGIAIEITHVVTGEDDRVLGGIEHGGL